MFSGFSLIELLIVMALILIMFVMLHGSGAQSFQRRQQRACNKNLQSISVALQIYANEHEGVFPIITNAQTSEAPLAVLVPQYTAATAPFVCPGSRDARLPEGEPFAERKISYAYYMGRRSAESAEPLLSDEQVDTLPKIKGRPIFSPDGKHRGNNHDKFGGNLLFVDGHVERVSPLAPYSILIPSNVVLLNPKR